MDKERFDRGNALRRAVLGDAYVDSVDTRYQDPFNKPLQEYFTEIIWGGIWARGGLPLKVRSLVVLGILIALGRLNLLAVQFKAAIRNGCSLEEIREVIFQAAGFAGSPSAVDALRVANEALAGEIAALSATTGEAPPPLSTESCRGLCVGMASVPDAELVPAQFVTGGAVTAKVVHGIEASLMIASRAPGYHSKPHRHDAEQLNYVLEGEIWIFLENGGFRARTGDVFRVPRNVLHWSRVGPGGCKLLEVHAPSLIGDEAVSRAALGLFSAPEGRPDMARTATDYTQSLDRDEVEERVRRELNLDS